MRRGLGMGRLLVGIGSVLAILGAFLPWTYAGGEIGLPMQTEKALDGGAGILMFIAAVALLALLILPYASPSGRSSLDRWVSFAILGGLMVVGTLLQLFQLFSSGTLKLLPLTDVLGLWLGVAGTLLVAWGAAEIVGQETRARSAEGPRQMTTFRARRRK
jgi:hypothetical protein